ncbi:uncharacterized protein B4U79_01078 [Dinothrombium tinctorium]|uniref:Uncharacterized protein n=1 Tax=Dinothrombium tinctorium TaxID=1965070 RepID=A0A3S3NR52_9ACAR|nr:uncharacterized protein B4U79_11441 [Dinothrombium tinctorium]RWS07682.1 uncharacterized protein B4U79_01078 [Dinothrombium tinctorium]
MESKNDSCGIIETSETGGDSSSTKMQRSHLPFEAKGKTTSFQTAKFRKLSSNTSYSKSGNRTLEEALKSEDDFMEYVMNLPSQASDVKTRKISCESMAPNETSKAGFEHLDNLCKLMQQLGELREANSKLQRKVQYLQDVKALQEDVKALQTLTPIVDEKCLSSDGSINNSESSRRKSDISFHYSPEMKRKEYNQTKNKTVEIEKSRRYAVHKSKSQNAVTLAFDSKRERSKSVGHEEIIMSASTDVKSATNKGTKRFPKWSKVKEALGFDKPQLQETHSSEAVYKQSNEMQRKNLKDIKTKSYSDADSGLFTENEAAIESKQRRPAARSPIKDQLKESTQNASLKSCDTDRSKQIRKEASICVESGGNEEIEIINDESCEKISKRGPWNRVKTMIQTRKDSIKKRSKKEGIREKLSKDSLGIEPDPASYVSLEVSLPIDDTYSEISVPLQDSKSLTDICMKVSGEESISRRHSECGSKVARDEMSIDCDEKQLAKREGKFGGSPSVSYIKKSKPKSLNLCLNDERQRFEEKSSFPAFAKAKHLSSNLGARTPSMSPPVQRRSKWNKMKKVFANAGEGVKPISTLAKCEGSAPNSVAVSPLSTSEASFTFDDLQEDFESCEDKSGEVSKISNLPQINMPPAAPIALVQALQRNLSEDFSRKIEEWEKLRNVRSSLIKTDELINEKLEKKSPSAKVVKKQKSERLEDKSQRHKAKDINWVEKELQKIEREKQRLSRERDKYDERAVRLEKLRDTVLRSDKSNKKEVLIRTSAGEFRFEGISDDFTKKLYEWETKRGVCPESSTIALLDSSSDLKKQMKTDTSGERSMFHRASSKSESSIFDVTGGSKKASSSSLPSLQQNDTNERTFLVLKAKKQISRAHSEPDIRTFRCLRKEMNEQETESKEMKKLERNEDLQRRVNAVSHLKRQSSVENPQSNEMHFPEDNYYSLLEDNMYLLEQLKTKEEICRRLEAELESLDDRMEEMNAKHQKEMEKYREKLWDVHINGSKSDDFQNSLSLIAELKERIEELQRCTERLKCDKETVEDSFRYHSEQQAKLTVELIEKMKDLQQMSISSGGGPAKEDGRRTPKKKSLMKCDAENVTRLHDLSTRLLQQARELDHILVERTRQICRLRWELLYKDVASMKLQTELHRAKWQTVARALDNTATAENKRDWFAQRRSWSSSERLNFNKITREIKNLELRNKLDQLSSLVHNDLPKIDFDSSELTNTIQQLKIELLKLCAQKDERSESEEVIDENEMSEQQQVTEQRNSIPISEVMCNYDINAEQNSTPQSKQISVRRNSAENVSSMSGPEGSESSSINDGERVSYSFRLPRNRWRKSHDNVSTSSESSYIEEENFTAVNWCRPRKSSEFSSEKDATLSHDDGNMATAELILQYANTKKNNGRNNSTSRSSSEVNDQRNDSWGELYRRKSLFNQFSETSSSAFNEGVEESSSASGHRFTSSFDTPDSTQSNLRSTSSSNPDRYGSIPMIDEDIVVRRTKLEDDVIPEGCVVNQSERRHSDPCKKYRYSIKPLKVFPKCDAAEEDETPSPVQFTVQLHKKVSNNSDLTESFDRSIKPEDSFQNTQEPKNEKTVETNETRKEIEIACSSSGNKESQRYEPAKRQKVKSLIEKYEKQDLPKKVEKEGFSEIRNRTASFYKAMESPTTNKNTGFSSSKENLSKFSTKGKDKFPNMCSDPVKGINPFTQKRLSAENPLSVKDESVNLQHSPSKGSLSSRVSSLISINKNRSRSNSKSDHSAVGALCRQSLHMFSPEEPETKASLSTLSTFPVSDFSKSRSASPVQSEKRKSGLFNLFASK